MLSKETTDQIRKEAEAIGSTEFEILCYRQGAEIWAEKAIVDEIDKELFRLDAEELAAKLYPYLDKNDKSITSKYRQIANERINRVRSAFVKGAETWAVWKQKAEVYEKALKEINEMSACYNAIAIAKNALEP